MTRFIGRRRELAELNTLLAEPGPQFLILYGRRRVGKTTLLLHWAQESGVPFVYWVANRLSPVLQLRSFSQALYNAAHPEAPADAEFTYPTWEMALAQAVDLAADRRLILILDEFPYVAEAEPGLPSVLQNMWDHRLKATQIFLVLAAALPCAPLRPVHGSPAPETPALRGHRRVSAPLPGRRACGRLCHPGGHPRLPGTL
jgi:AAA+ ATPase superfamily predicted ATPase